MKPKTFATASYSIDKSNAESGRAQVSGKLNCGGLLAIHKDPVLGWVIDHLPTGYWVVYLPTLRQAKAFVSAVSDLDWNFTDTDPERARGKAFVDCVMETYKEIKRQKRQQQTSSEEVPAV